MDMVGVLEPFSTREAVATAQAQKVVLVGAEGTLVETALPKTGALAVEVGVA